MPQKRQAAIRQPRALVCFKKANEPTSQGGCAAQEIFQVVVLDCSDLPSPLASTAKTIAVELVTVTLAVEPLAPVTRIEPVLGLIHLQNQGGGRADVD